MFVFLLVVLVGLSAGLSSETVKPNIAVLSEPFFGDGSYIAASYIKFVEAGGGLAVPLRYDLPKDEFFEIIRSVNGLLLPGGGAPLAKGSAYYDMVETLLREVHQINSGGEFFPVFATCLGFEEVLQYMSQNYTLISSTNITNSNVPGSLRLVSQWSTDPLESDTSGLLVQVRRWIRSDEAKMYFNHQQGVTVENWNQNPHLSDLFNVIAESTTAGGEEIIAWVEGKSLPFTAVQFHPEKPLFESSPLLNISRSVQSRLTSTYLATSFIEQAKRNSRRFPTLESCLQASIRNWQPLDTASTPDTWFFDQIYSFPASEQPHVVVLE